MRKTLERRLQSLRWGFTGQQLSPPKSLDAAGQYFRLDLKDPDHRERLLFILAEAVFGKGRAGRPKGRHGPSGGWNVRKLDRLGLLYNKYHRDGFRGDKKIADQIHANHKREFGSTAEAIRRWLPYARWTHEELSEKHFDYDRPDGWNEDDGSDDGKDE
jgi:hypothetical protein